jgi:hypothetical protein
MSTIKKRKKKTKDGIIDDDGATAKRSHSGSPVGESPASSTRSSPIDASKASSFSRNASPSEAQHVAAPQTARRRHKALTDVNDDELATRSQSSPLLVVSPDILNETSSSPPSNNRQHSPRRLHVVDDGGGDSEHSSSQSLSTDQSHLVSVTDDGVVELRLDARRAQRSSQSSPLLVSTHDAQRDLPDGPPGKLPTKDDEIALSKASRHARSRRLRTSNESPRHQSAGPASAATSTTTVPTATEAPAAQPMLPRASSSSSKKHKASDSSPLFGSAPSSEHDKRRLSGPAMSSSSLASSMQLEEARSQNAALKARVERHRGACTSY